MLCAGFAALAGLLGGCIFSPEKSPKPKPPPPIVYPILEKPSRVLLALETAYAKRDSVGYVNLFDRYEYTGESYDPSNDSTKIFRWVDEQKHIQRLAEVATITGDIYFDLGSETSWTRLSSDDLAHPEWAVIQISGSVFTIRIDDGPDTYVVHGPSEFFTFTFKPTTPAPSSPSDTLWSIVRWKENL
jgi:hypothetical protein